VDGILIADLARFKQVLYNLISNAVKFTPPGGRVSVRCRWVAYTRAEGPSVPRDQARAVRIDVADTGIGIAPEDQTKLGTEFFQARRGPHKAQEGTGLGLALSRRLVEMMGGQFWFESELNHGSTFSFALSLQPHRASDTPLPDTGEEAEEVSDGRLAARPLALIVDDHKPTNKLLADWLEEAGLRTASAFDGPTGLELADRLRPQLILLDIRLPGLSGLELLTQLKSNAATADIPVVVISVLEGQEELQEVDVVDWLVKPLEKEQLIRRLQSDLPALFQPERTVLIVEDDTRTRKWLRDLLFAEGLQVREAENGAVALEIMRQETPDLILLDLLMPEMNGFQMVQAIRANPEWEQIPIIILTAKEITPEDGVRLKRYTQGLFRKDHFTSGKLLDRLQRLGLLLAPRGNHQTR
jgi:CheY-like chemotaxis protein